jgi:hypothetical protein
MDVAHELTYLGFEQYKDFDIGPVRGTVLSGGLEDLGQTTREALPVC